MNPYTDEAYISNPALGAPIAGMDDSRLQDYHKYLKRNIRASANEGWCMEKKTLWEALLVKAQEEMKNRGIEIPLIVTDLKK